MAPGAAAALEGWEEASKDFVEKRAAVLEKADLIAAAQELFEAVPEDAEVGRAARKWVDAQEIRDEQEREKKTRENLVGIWVTQINKQTSDKQVTNKQKHRLPTTTNKKVIKKGRCV